MREEHPKCPEPGCGKPLDPVHEEVDIEVGVQTFLTGYECPEHGGICGVCYGCNKPNLPRYEHYDWCDRKEEKS